MIMPDANIILYAYNEDASQHLLAKEWLEEQFTNANEFGLSWQVITAFLRISTNPKAFPQDEPIEIVEEWLSLPNLQILSPTENHWTIFQELIIEAQTKAALMMDAHLAALAIEHNATLAITDRDFSKFSNLNYFNPLST